MHIVEWKKPHTVQFQLYHILEKAEPKTVRAPVVVRGWEEGGRAGGAQRVCRAERVLCATLQWWYYVFIPMSITHGLPNTRSEPRANWGLQLMISHPPGSPVGTSFHTKADCGGGKWELCLLHLIFLPT